MAERIWVLFGVVVRMGLRICSVGGVITPQARAIFWIDMGQPFVL